MRTYSYRTYTANHHQGLHRVLNQIASLGEDAIVRNNWVPDDATWSAPWWIVCRQGEQAGWSVDPTWALRLYQNACIGVHLALVAE